MRRRIRPRQEPPAWLHLVPIKKQSEGHVATRFDDHTPVKVYLDDVEVSNDCVEALVGPQGWVILVGKPVPMATELDYRREHGNVRVVKIPVVKKRKPILVE